MGLRNVMRHLKRWVTGGGSRVHAMHDKLMAETEAVSQEAKALKHQLKCIGRDDDAFDMLIADMKRVHKARRNVKPDIS